MSLNKQVELSLFKAPRCRRGFLLVAVAAVIGSAPGCSTSMPDKSAALRDAGLPFADKLVSEQNPRFAQYRPSCIYVRSFDDPDQKDLGQVFRKAFHSQLAVTGVRLIPLQARLDDEQVKSCEVELRGKVVANDKRFMGVYSDYKAAVEVELFHRSHKDFLWRGSDEISKRDGGLPLGLISTILGLMNAAQNIELEQEGRIAYELAARVVSQIPNLTYQPQADASTANLDSPDSNLSHSQNERAVDFLVRMNDLPVSARGVHFRKFLEDSSGLSIHERNLLREEWFMIDPSNTELGVQVLEDRVSFARYADSIELAGALIERSKGLDARAYKLRALARGALGQYDLAAHDELKVIALGNRTGDAYFSLGRTYARLGQFELSSAALEKAVELKPDNTEMLLYLGVSLSVVGNTDRAFGHLRRALILEMARNNRSGALKVRNTMLSTETYNLFSETERKFVEQQLDQSI